MREALVIYTDGSARGNGFHDATGGFGVVVCDAWKKDKEEDFNLLQVYQEQRSGATNKSHKPVTNNRMEMEAILWVLENFGNPGGNAIYSKDGDELMATSLTPIVYSDSSYAVNTFTNWIYTWKQNGWIRSKGKPIENLDLVKRWDDLTTNHHYKIDLRYTRGHNGNKWNELADALATGRVKASSIEDLITLQNIQKDLDWGKIDG